MSEVRASAGVTTDRVLDAGGVSLSAEASPLLGAVPSDPVPTPGPGPAVACSGSCRFCRPVPAFTVFPRTPLAEAAIGEPGPTLALKAGDGSSGRSVEEATRDGGSGDPPVTAESGGNGPDSSVCVPPVDVLVSCLDCSYAADARAGSQCKAGQVQ